MAVSSGIYSLAGVLVGGGITAGAQWSLAARADRSDARVAKRQVRAELQRLKPLLGWYLSFPAESIHGFPEPFPIEKWTTHSDRLARQLSDLDWQVVESAYAQVEDIEFLRNRLVRQSEEVQQASTKDLEKAARRALHLINEAINRLR